VIKGVISSGDGDTARYEDLDNKSQRVNELFAFKKEGSLVFIPRVEFELRAEHHEGADSFTKAMGRSRLLHQSNG